ncbi:MAG TPA: preprotein translocase subunit SecE, partial [Gemmataceae bacterium]|nr:preprotein translocase subunit SecE [Gemmataceae bacterium]
TPNPPANLAFASLVGAAYVVAAVVVVFYALPNLWRQSVSPELVGYGPIDFGLRWCVQIAAGLGLWWFGQTLAGANPPKGLRGGIFLMISFAITAFFVLRRVGLEDAFSGALFFALLIAAGVLIFALYTQSDRLFVVLVSLAAIAVWYAVPVATDARQTIATAAVAVLLLFGLFQFFVSERGEGYMVRLEEQGWFHAHAYKRVLGQKVRRLTILGLLLIGATGVYSLWYQGMIPANWVLAMPFGWEPVTVIPEARYVIPLLLVLLNLWIAYRMVNLPMFAEFLIATEAEMNKVSWTTRKRLAQDTVVVLVTTLLLTLFLLLVDVFWGWLLSRETVGVLPSRSAADKKQDVDKPVDW